MRQSGSGQAVVVERIQQREKFRNRAWLACAAAAALVLVLTYSPLVLTGARTGPWFFGLPRVLWAGFVSAAALVLLTCIGAVVHPRRSDDDA